MYIIHVHFTCRSKITSNLILYDQTLIQLQLLDLPTSHELMEVSDVNYMYFITYFDAVFRSFV